MQPEQPQLTAKPRRITWSPRLAAGAGLAAACLLLWPFTGWSWLPFAVGLGLLVLLRLLRLDGLLRGWAPHLAGVVVLVLLMLSVTQPWALALAGSLAVVVAGLTQLPRWQLLVVGAVLAVGSTVGFVLSTQQAQVEQARQRDVQANLDASTQQIKEPRLIVEAVMKRIAAEDTVPNSAANACALLSDEARAQFASSAGMPDCQAAIHQLSGAVTDRTRYREPIVPESAVQRSPGAAVVDGCRASWAPGPAPGPKLGRFSLTQLSGPGRGYFVTGYAPCS